jgi:hypothetical protein
VLPTTHSIKGELRKYSNMHHFTVELIIPVLLAFRLAVALQSVLLCEQKPSPSIGLAPGTALFDSLDEIGPWLENAGITASEGPGVLWGFESPAQNRKATT